MRDTLNIMITPALSPLSIFMHDLQRQLNSEMIHIECDNAKAPYLSSTTHLRQRPHSMATMDEAKLKLQKDIISTEMRTNSMPVLGTMRKSASTTSRWEIGCCSPPLMKDKITNAKWDSRVEKPRRRLSAEKSIILPLVEQMVSSTNSFSITNGPSSFSQEDSAAATRYQLPDYQAALAAVQQRYSPSSTICNLFPPPPVLAGGSAPRLHSRKVHLSCRETTTRDLLSLPTRRASIEDDDDLSD